MTVETHGMTLLLQVYDMAEALAFYRDVLGFEVMDASPEVETPEGVFSHWMWLRLGPVDLMLNTAYDAGERPPARDAARQSWHGDTYLNFGCPDVDAVHAALKPKLADLPAPVDMPYGMRELRFKDPDGYVVCFKTRMLQGAE